jgi:hypothetical protein
LPVPRDKRVSLTGPSRQLDRRVHAVRNDIADIALADDVFAPHYAKPLVHGCVVPSVPIRAGGSPGARAVSELLLGEAFAVVDVASGWAWGYGLHDNYVGYLPVEMLGVPQAPTQRIAVPAALEFAEPDIKAPVLARLPMGALVTGELEDDFLRTATGFFHARHVAPLSAPETDPVAVAERLIGTPYRWGGRSGDGIDCSGLVQLAHGFAGNAVPRDSDQQQVIGAPLAPDTALQRGDLIFFPGHVGLMSDAETIVHANAHWMAVTREPLGDVIARLSILHADPVVARRRP